MSRINKLTKEQEARIEPFKKEFLDCVLSPVSDDVVRRNGKNFYELLGIKDATVIILDNPIFIALSIILLSSQLGDQLKSQLVSQLYDQLNRQLGSQLNRQLSDQLKSQFNIQLYGQLHRQLYDQLKSQFNIQLYIQLYSQHGGRLYDQLHSQLGNQLNSQLDSQLRSQLGGQLGSQLKSQFNIQLYGQLHSQLYDQLRNWYTSTWWGGNVGYYEFAKHIGVKFEEPRTQICSEFIKHAHIVFPFKNILFCPRKPTTRWKDGVLHSESKPAIEFRGGLHIYCLNGIRVTKEIVETKAEDLNPKIIFKETNAEVRREVVRKIGIERVCQKLGAKQIDKSGDGVYELLDLNLDDGRFRPYLKMRNPSIGVYHLEGVHPDCRTVAQALNWRNGTKEKPIILT